jgi:hypothetical protein
MCLQELMDLIVIMKLIIALLKMLDPVEAGILNLRRKAFLYSDAFDISDEYTGTALIADILLESCGYQTYASIGHCPMRLLLVHLEIRISASILIKKEVAK